MQSRQLQLIDLTGIEVIDDQHDRLLNLVRELAALAESQDREQIARAIIYIISQTLDHFEFEEELMEHAGYPFIRVHRRLHRHFIQRTTSYTQRFDAGEEVIPEMVEFMGKWLHNHFIHEDRDYSPHILTRIAGEAVGPGEARNDSWWQRALSRS
ncbi:MAG: bacteriohemerythrin [Chromatiales bacterium]|nr:bacteriohemerythrin [Chromatiales bacterium]